MAKIPSCSEALFRYITKMIRKYDFLSKNLGNVTLSLSGNVLYNDTG
jgi:hypothetical protein